MRIQGYIRPKSLSEALEILDGLGPEGAILAGGTDLLIEARAGRLKASTVVDISRLEELKILELDGERIRVGAALTFSEIASSAFLRSHAPVLCHAASQIGSLQIRNVATIGGNVVHCSPCADSVPALLVHRARAVVRSKDTFREEPIERLLLGPYRSGIKPGEIITEFVLQEASHLWGTFRKLARRRELAVSRLSIAVLIRKEFQKIREAYVALGSGTPVPRRMEQVEMSLVDTPPEESDLWRAGRILSQEMVATSGLRPSTLYKSKAVAGLLVRALLPLVHHES